jgi:hypothetical protein
MSCMEALPDLRETLLIAYLLFTALCVGEQKEANHWISP